MNMIRTVRSHMNVEALSHPGMTGKNNEDRYAVASFQLDDHNKMPVLFAVLADGIGGHRGGEVAAELAVNHIMQAVAKSDARHIRDTIQGAVTEASDAIAAHAATNEDLKGMGATCATAWIVGDKLHTAYVGDSRIYLMRGGRIQQLTTDHTWVQEAMEKNILTPEQARAHPNVHVIRRYLGSVLKDEHEADDCGHPDQCSCDEVFRMMGHLRLRGRSSVRSGGRTSSVRRGRRGTRIAP